MVFLDQESILTGAEYPFPPDKAAPKGGEVLSSECWVARKC